MRYHALTPRVLLRLHAAFSVYAEGDAVNRFVKQRHINAVAVAATPSSVTSSAKKEKCRHHVVVEEDCLIWFNGMNN